MARKVHTDIGLALMGIGGIVLFLALICAAFYYGGFLAGLAAIGVVLTFLGYHHAE